MTDAGLSTKDFTDHYTAMEADGQQVIPTFDEAKKLASGDEKRIWFVRIGDECECDEEDPDYDEDEGCQCESTWDIQLYFGQHVNAGGFMVSTEPCKPGDENEIFTY